MNVLSSAVDDVRIERLWHTWILVKTTDIVAQSSLNACHHLLSVEITYNLDFNDYKQQTIQSSL